MWDGQGRGAVWMWDQGCRMLGGVSLWMQDRDAGCSEVRSLWTQHQRWDAQGVSLWMQDWDAGCLGQGCCMDVARGM